MAKMTGLKEMLIIYAVNTANSNFIQYDYDVTRVVLIQTYTTKIFKSKLHQVLAVEGSIGLTESGTTISLAFGETSAGLWEANTNAQLFGCHLWMICVHNGLRYNWLAIF